MFALKFVKLSKTYQSNWEQIDLNWSRDLILKSSRNKLKMINKTNLGQGKFNENVCS